MSKIWNFITSIKRKFTLKEDLKREEKDLIDAEKSVERVEEDFIKIIEDIHQDMQDLNREQEIEHFSHLTSIEKKECCERMKRFLPVMKSRFPEGNSWDQIKRLIDLEVNCWGLLCIEEFEADSQKHLADIKELITKEEAILVSAGKEAANKKATTQDIEKFLIEMEARQAL